VPGEPREAPASLQDAYRRWRASRLGQITDSLEEELILELVGSPAGLRILDVGCGDGVLAAPLARGGALVTGVDTDPHMLAAGRARAQRAGLAAEFVEGDIRALPFTDATFDVVITVTVLCFVPDAERAVCEMVRVLKPEGRMVVGELGRWNLWAAKRRISGCLAPSVWSAARFRTAGELRRLAINAGVSVTATRGAIFYPPCAAAAALLAPRDSWLGQRTTTGAAFLAVAGGKSSPQHTFATDHQLRPLHAFSQSAAHTRRQGPRRENGLHAGESAARGAAAEGVG
jgi:SAM-dependent methyltransferase